VERGGQRNAACRILVVDDDCTIIEGMKVVLETAGYEVLTATKAEDALAILQGDCPPDAIVADFRLGGAITGIALIEEARRRTGKTFPGIVVTGDTNVCSRPELTVLHKPVAPDLLTKTLVRICP
jgi:DNA-binding NtrC family response regulator